MTVRGPSRLKHKPGCPNQAQVYILIVKLRNIVPGLSYIEDSEWTALDKIPKSHALQFFVLGG
jgi:hypothetical protein